MLRRLLVLGLLLLIALGGGRALMLVAAAGPADATEPGELARLGSGQHRVAMVFGAGLNRDGAPSALLMDRIRASKALLDRGTVDLLLMTGDNSRSEYNEPSAMRAAAMTLGVPAARIAVDYGGRRTWDSCVRGRKIFGVRSAITVTNDFHRARTVVLCKAAGIEVEGAVGTSTRGYALSKRAKWRSRELLASWRGASDAWISHPDVAVGGDRIDPHDPCAVWRSLSPNDRAKTPDARPADC